MKRVIAGAFLVALWCSPTVARAQIAHEARAAATEAPGGRLAETAPAESPLGEAADYAAREAAAPELGEFEGGHAGVYIGGGVLTVVLIVLLVVVIL